MPSSRFYNDTDDATMMLAKLDYKCQTLSKRLGRQVRIVQMATMSCWPESIVRVVCIIALASSEKQLNCKLLHCTLSPQ